MQSPFNSVLRPSSFFKVLPVVAAEPPASAGDIISDFDFTTASPQTDDTLFSGDGLAWTNRRVTGLSSTESWQGSPPSAFMRLGMDGGDGETPEKRSFVDAWRTITGYDALQEGDVLDVTIEMRASGYGFLFFDFELGRMASDAGDLNFNGVRIGVDPAGGFDAIRTELSSAYPTFQEVPAAPIFPLDTWVTMRIIVNASNTSAGRIRMFMDGVLVLDDTGPNMWNAADVLASDGITLDTDATPVEVDTAEAGGTALYNSITGAVNIDLRRFTARIEFA